MSRLGLKWKVSLICLALVVGPLITLGARISHQVEHYFLEALHQTLQAHARLAVKVIQEESLSRKPRDLHLLCRQLSNTIDAEVYVIDPSGTRIADSIAPHVMGQGTANSESRKMKEGCALCHAEVDVLGRVTAAANFSGGVLPGHRVVVSTSMYGAKRVVSKVRRMVLGTTVLAVVVATLLTLRLAAGVVEPITRMSRMAEVIAEGDFNQRLDSKRQDEVGRLAQSLNRMAARIQSMITRLVDQQNARRKFVADVSHELRTPVTALRTSIDALLDGAIDDPETRPEFLAALDNQSAKLCHLVDDLLDMSVVEAVGVDEERECVPLLQVTQRILREIALTIDRKELNVTVDIESDVRVLGDPRQMEVLMANLLDNAVKYNRQGGAVLIRARREVDCVITRIADNGIGIQPRDLDHIFDRFYRSEEARSSEMQGTGLGLAIAKDIVETHGGRIHAESAPGKGSAFTFTLAACGSGRSRTDTALTSGEVNVGTSTEPLAHEDDGEEGDDRQ